jgi:F-type H+-transporting ATPase subunit b
MKLRNFVFATTLAFGAVAAPLFTSTAHATTEPAAESVAGEPAAEAPAEAKKGGTAQEEREHCIKILEAGEPIENCVKAPNPILPAASEILWGAVAFFALFALLAKVAMPAIRKTMDARSAKIAGDLGAAEKAKADGDKLVAEYQAKLADAKKESDRIIEEGRAQADQVRKDLIARAEADAAAIRAKAAEDLGVQSDRLKADLQTHVRSLSLDLAEKVVGANMTTDANSALVDRYIAELAKK